MCELDFLRFVSYFPRIYVLGWLLVYEAKGSSLAAEVLRLFWFRWGFYVCFKTYLGHLEQTRETDERHEINCFPFFDSIMRCPMGWI